MGRARTEVHKSVLHSDWGLIGRGDVPGGQTESTAYSDWSTPHQDEQWRHVHDDGVDDDHLVGEEKRRAET